MGETRCYSDIEPEHTLKSIVDMAYTLEQNCQCKYSNIIVCNDKCNKKVLW